MIGVAEKVKRIARGVMVLGKDKETAMVTGKIAVIVEVTERNVVTTKVRVYLNDEIGNHIIVPILSELFSLDCKGSGRIRCEECDGKKKLRFFEVMHQIFETLTNTKVVDNIPDDELPPALLVSAPGKF